MVERVTSKGGILIKETKKPLKEPAKVATAIPISAEISIFNPILLERTPIVIALKLKIDPMDKSIPPFPEIIINVSASANNPISTPYFVKLTIL